MHCLFKTNVFPIAQHSLLQLPRNVNMCTITGRIQKLPMPRLVLFVTAGRLTGAPDGLRPEGGFERRVAEVRALREFLD